MNNSEPVSCPNCGSQIIHESAPDLNEKLVGYLVPTEIFQCQPCGCRFLFYGNPLAHEKTRRVIVPLSLVFVFLFSMAAYMIVGGSKPPSQRVPADAGQLTLAQNKPVEKPTKKNIKSTPAESLEKPDQTPTQQPKVDKPNQDPPKTEKNPKTDSPKAQKDKKPGREQAGDTQATPDQKKPDKKDRQPEVKKATPAQAVAGTIKMGNSRKFGVNWTFQPNRGLVITRLAQGPLKKAGLRIGDALLTVDGTPLTGSGEVLRARNEVFAGSRQKAIIEAVRDGKKFVYELVK